MSDERTGSGSESPSPGAVLQEIDSDLNIFALANGLDLYRDPEDRPARVLEWYGDQMERRIVLTPVAGRSARGLDLAIGAESRREGRRHLLSRPFRTGVAPGELRDTLPRAIDAANALTRAEVESEGRPR
jgi:hypothetical protein